MIKDSLYATATTVDGIAMTRPIEDMYEVDYQPERAPSDLALPYYMGYIDAADFPDCLRPMRYTYHDGDKTLSFEFADIRQNYSWFFGSQSNSGGGAYLRRALYSLEDTEDGQKWTAHISTSSIRFINDMVLANITWSGFFQLQGKRITYTKSTDTYAYNSYADISINTSISEYNDFLQNKHEYILTINSVDYTIRYSDFIEDELCWKINIDDDTQLIVGITKYFFQPKPAMNAAGTTLSKNQIQPLFKVTADDEKNYYLNYMPDNYDVRLVIMPDFTFKEFSNLNTYIKYSENAYFFLNSLPIDLKKVYENHNSNNTGRFFLDGRFYEYTGGTASAGYQWRPTSCIHPKSVFFILSFYNKTTNQIDTAAPEGSHTYTDAHYVPTYTEDDVPTGVLINGQYDDIKDKLRPWQDVDASITDNTYDDADKPAPVDPPEPDPDDEVTEKKPSTEDSLPNLSIIRFTSGDVFTTFYELAHIAAIGSLLSAMPETFWQALGTATDYKQTNLLDYIVSLKWYPIDIKAADTGLYADIATDSIQFGFNGASVIHMPSDGLQDYKLQNINRVYRMGSVFIPYRDSNQSFLDLEPYTTVTAYLPYIGTVTLQCEDVIGYTVSCVYIIDLTTGMATSILYNDYNNATIYIGAGKIGTDITVAGNDVITQSERMAGSYISAATGMVNNALSISTAATEKNVTGLVSAGASSVADIATSAISIANSKRGIPESVGSASGFGGAYTHQSPYITVRRPAVSIPGKYGHDIGYVCNRSYAIGSLSGFTVCDNPDLSGIAATTAELDLIRQILTTGFYA